MISGTLAVGAIRGRGEGSIKDPGASLIGLVLLGADNLLMEKGLFVKCLENWDLGKASFRRIVSLWL